jgi:acetyltransferase-like isoleucine patch superfamily enzyme
MNIIKTPFKVYKLKTENGYDTKIFPRIDGRFEIGKHTLISEEAEVRSYRGPRTVKVGKFCSIGRARFIIDANHNPYYASTFPFKELWLSHKAPENELRKYVPSVGNDCWLGDDCHIYSGVAIQDGAIVAGNSVVTKDVPPYAIVAGNPAKVVKYRFDEVTIERLLNVKWWDLDDDIIMKRLAPVIDDVPLFLEKAEKYRSRTLKM